MSNEISDKLKVIQEWIEKHPDKNFVDAVLAVSDVTPYGKNLIMESCRSRYAKLPKNSEINWSEFNWTLLERLLNEQQVTPKKAHPRLEKVDDLKQEMQRRGFNELLIVPLNCNGDLMCDYEYEDICGEWLDGSDWPDSEMHMITRFGIIEDKLFYRMVDYDAYNPPSTDSRESEWLPIEEYSSQGKLYEVISDCINDSFPWDFTRTHPGSRYLPFDINIEEFVASFKGKSDLSYVFSGLDKIVNLDLSSLNEVELECFEDMLMGCTSLETVNFSGVKIRDEYTGEVFDRCDSLKEVKMLGCNESTVNAIKEYVLKAKLPNKVKIISDNGEIMV